MRREDAKFHSESFLQFDSVASESSIARKLFDWLKRNLNEEAFELFVEWLRWRLRASLNFSDTFTAIFIDNGVDRLLAIELVVTKSRLPRVVNVAARIKSIRARLTLVGDCLGVRDIDDDDGEDVDNLTILE